MITIEVVYALLKEQTLLSFKVERGMTVKDAIIHSGILTQYPSLNIEKMDVGLFGKMTKMTQVLRDKDRIEIYRPLIADPKAIRKQRAAAGKRMNKGGGNARNKKS